MGNAFSTRSATRFRRLLTMLIALALALGGLSGLGSNPAAAQDAPENDAEQITQRDFDRLTRAGQRNEVIYGPESGALELEEETVAFESADVEVENFLAHVEFTNPYGATDGQWDYGLQFRSQSEDAFLRLILLSDGTWGLTEGLENVPATGIVETVNDGEGETNAIDLYVDGDIGHFGLNGDYVVTFELPVDGAGDITVGSGFLANSFQDGAETEYAEFIIWTLDEGGLGPDDEELSDDDLTATADAEDEELSDDDLTATADAEDEELSDDDLTATAEAEEELSDDDLTATAEAEDEELSDDDLTATADAEDEELSDDDLTATAEAEDERGSTDDPTYTSPTFGYTLSYDDPWELSDEISDEDGDLLELTTRNSNLQIVGNESNDTPEECIDALIEDVEDTRDVSDVEIAQDDRDRDLRDDSDELSWVVLFFTLEDEDGNQTEITGYYECRVIEEGDSLLTVIHLALSDDYNDEIDNRTDVLDTIEVDGGSTRGGDDDETRTPTEEPEDDDTETRTPTEEPDEDDATPTEQPDDDATVVVEVAEGTIFVFLESVGDSEILPFGSVEPSGRNESRVFLFAIGAGGSLVTIHEGSCSNPGEAAFEVGQIDESGLLDETIDVATEDIATGDFVMLVSTDGTEDTALACGVLEPPVEE